MPAWANLAILFTFMLLAVFSTISVCGMVWNWSEKRKALRQKQLEDSAVDSSSADDESASAVLERSKRFIESIPDEDKALPRGIRIGLADLKKSLSGILSRLSDVAEKGISASTADLLGKIAANRSGFAKTVEATK